MHPIDPWRAANLLVKQLAGSEAERYAEERLFAFSELKDADGDAVWAMILRAVQELRRTEPREQPLSGLPTPP